MYNKMTKQYFDLASEIEKSRKIKPSSLNTYISSLRQISNDVTGSKTIKNLDFLKNFDKVMKTINKLDLLTSKKNRLTSIIVALSIDKEGNKKLIDKYSEILGQLTDKYMSILTEQKKTDKQEMNWVDYEELLKIQKELKKIIMDKNILKKDKLSRNDFNQIQRWIIWSTYIKHPLRNDFADMRVVKSDNFKKLPEKDINANNFLVLYPKKKKEFHINQFKNVDSIGKKVINVDDTLSRMYDVWLKYNKSGWLFVKINDPDTPMNPNNITKYLQNISLQHAKKDPISGGGKRIGSSMIRHIVISHMLKNQPTIKEQEQKEKEIEDKFLHSKSMNGLYRKID